MFWIQPGWVLNLCPTGHNFTQESSKMVSLRAAGLASVRSNLRSERLHRPSGLRHQATLRALLRFVSMFFHCGTQELHRPRADWGGKSLILIVIRAGNACRTEFLRSIGKFAVSRPGKNYDERARGLNRKFRLEGAVPYPPVPPGKLPTVAANGSGYAGRFYGYWIRTRRWSVQ
jgi:hypothetical protein